MERARPIPFGNLGCTFDGDWDINDAMAMANADYIIEQQDICLLDGTIVPNKKANVIAGTNTVLGIVTNRWREVQPYMVKPIIRQLKETLGDRMRINNIGYTRDFRRMWIVCELPVVNIGGDEVIQYMIISNAFDGSGSVKVILTPIRIVCNNALTVALNNATRIWSIRHTGFIENKLDQASKSIMLAEHYMTELDEYAQVMINYELTDKVLSAILDKCFKIGPKASEREIRTLTEKREQFMECYWMNDIDRFRGTAWGALNAMADFVSHETPARRTRSFEEKRWTALMDGTTLIDKMVKELNTVVASDGIVV